MQTRPSSYVVITLLCCYGSYSYCDDEKHKASAKNYNTYYAILTCKTYSMHPPPNGCVFDTACRVFFSFSGVPDGALFSQGSPSGNPLKLKYKMNH